MEPTTTGSNEARITLAEAAKTVPGHPHTSAIWRWARKGVKARSGERIRLRHTRVGGRVFTTLAWIEEFGERLAEADAVYFDARMEAQARQGRQARSPQDHADASQHDAIRRELEAEGL